MKDLSKMTEQEKKAVLARREYMKQWRKRIRQSKRNIPSGTLQNSLLLIRKKQKNKKKPSDLRQQIRRQTKHQHRQPSKAAA